VSTIVRPKKSTAAKGATSRQNGYDGFEDSDDAGVFNQRNFTYRGVKVEMSAGTPAT
jgi:hypothetical protein